MEFVVTPRIRKALDDVGDDGLKHLIRYKSETVETIPLQDLKLLSTVYRSKLLAENKPVRPAFLHELCQSSSIVTTSGASERPVDPEFRKKLERLRHKAERREYDAMVNSISPSHDKFRIIPANDGSDGKDVNLKDDLGLGLNIITLMATGFFVFYMGAYGIWPGNKTLHMACGLIGLFLAMMLEMVLFIVRERKKEIREQKFGKAVQT